MSLVVLPRVAVRDLWAHTRDVLTSAPSLDVFCELDVDTPQRAQLEVTLRKGECPLRTVRIEKQLAAGYSEVSLALEALVGIELWDTEHPNLYRVDLQVLGARGVTHSRSICIGFRDANFQMDGFYLNGRKLRLFGLNRHELFPYVGFAASDRAHRKDAEVLRHELNCNIVRCSHYPQSEAFLNACDELGLMVWEEIPGWQYLGDGSWQNVAVKNVEEMVRRDRNHPSIVVWGTRVNESRNEPGLYVRTREAAKKLDHARPTSGSMTSDSRRDWHTQWKEDIFAFDDYHAAPDGSVGIDPAVPGVPYMLAEAVGQFSYGKEKNFLRRYRRAGKPSEQASQALLHAQAHDRAASDPHNAGVIAWCAFDYGSPMNACNGVKCPGVVDVFRILKLGAAFYKSQVSPNRCVVIEPGFAWDGPASLPTGKLAIFSNCSELRLFVDGEPVNVSSPDKANFPNLKYPPFVADLQPHANGRVLRMDGYSQNRLVLSRSFSSERQKDRLWIQPDYATIQADGTDSTRVSFGVCDSFGNARHAAEGRIRVHLVGPATLIGDEEFDLHDTGGVAAVWLRSRQGQTGQAELTILHDTLGALTTTIAASVPRP